MLYQFHTLVEKHLEIDQGVCYNTVFQGFSELLGHFSIRKRPRYNDSHKRERDSRRFSAAASASARLSQKVEAAGPPDPTIGSGRCSPERGCHEVTGLRRIFDSLRPHVSAIAENKTDLAES